MAKIYTDTNVLRYFGTAFANATLSDDLRNKLLLAPLAVMELSHSWGPEVLKKLLPQFMPFHEYTIH